MGSALPGLDYYVRSKIDYILNHCYSKSLANKKIKIQSLLGKKAMTNLDSILKSRDITLLIKVHPVKAAVFPVVMYGFESQTIKKAEC